MYMYTYYSFVYKMVLYCSRSVQLPGMIIIGTLKIRWVSKALSVSGAGVSASSMCSASNKNKTNVLLPCRRNITQQRVPSIRRMSDQCKLQPDTSISPSIYHSQCLLWDKTSHFFKPGNFLCLRCRLLLKPNTECRLQSFSGI